MSKIKLKLRIISKEDDWLLRVRKDEYVFQNKSKEGNFSN